MTDRYLLNERGLELVFQALERDGRTVIGPSVGEGAIVYKPLRGLQDLPRGLGDRQAPAQYRLETRTDGLWFAYAAPARPLKSWFRPDRERLVTLRRGPSDLVVEAEPVAHERVALFGVRACDLVGLRRLDSVLLSGPHRDERYATRREDVLVIAAHCTHPAGTCFCASMGTGPRADAFDLGLIEGIRGSEHLFLLEVGSDAGAALLRGLELRPATSQDQEWARELSQRAVAMQQRAVNPELARQALAEALEHRHWGEVAGRCMACANCTASCPTCFCSSIEDETLFDADRAERWRRTDSCFNSDFSHVHGGSVRASVRARYRQWLVHKFSNWYPQFGTSGCVGCGRCITWCPVGIDVTQEIAQLSAPEAGV